MLACYKSLIELSAYFENLPQVGPGMATCAEGVVAGFGNGEGIEVGGGEGRNIGVRVGEGEGVGAGVDEAEGEGVSAGVDLGDRVGLPGGGKPEAGTRGWVGVGTEGRGRICCPLMLMLEACEISTARPKILAMITVIANTARKSSPFEGC